MVIFRVPAFAGPEGFVSSQPATAARQRTRGGALGSLYKSASKRASVYWRKYFHRLLS